MPAAHHACRVLALLSVSATLALTTFCGWTEEPKPAQQAMASIDPPHFSKDPSVKLDYDIVYVRAPRHGEEKRGGWAEFSDPTRMEPGADLMLLHPDGREELLVSGADGSVMDPYVSFDGEWVYYAKFIDAKHTGADIHKIHVKSRKTVRLTDQTFTPNTGAAPWAKDYRTPEPGKTALRYGVYNLGPCPVPPSPYPLPRGGGEGRVRGGGKVVFTSNRNAYVPPRGYPKITLQLFIMDEDGSNVEQIGYLNVACALHPVVLKDGRILFSTLESQGTHNSILWGIWSIHPDGTNWGPVVSAFATDGAPSGFHFQSQLSDGSIIVEEYYNLNNSGFGTYFKLPAPPSSSPPFPLREGGPGGLGEPAFAPGDLTDPRNSVDGYGGRGKFRAPFVPRGIEVLTRFTHGFDGPAPSSLPKEQVKARVHGGESYPHAMGKVTHPCGAPDNHLLTVWSSGPVNHQYNYYPLIDAGIYLIKDGKPIDEPGRMLLIKNDPKYNEQWPRPLVSYKRIYGVDEPKRLVHSNNGKQSPHLPEGTPFGLIGTSSLYKRESAPGGKVPPGSVTAVVPDRNPKDWYWSPWRTNWGLQGADAGLYDNREIHALRIVAQEPRTDIGGNGTHSPPLFGNHALERLRILGEIPVRKFPKPGSQGAGLGTDQPLDPDGNPDTSFLAKIPADQPFTFQTLDKDGLVLNMAQTWHQLRPGEIRTNCGGCHAHSQKPTLFEKTAAARPDYTVFDLTNSVPLLTDKARDESGKQWDTEDRSGLRFVKGGAVNVEYHRDIKPILQRSCVACHTGKAEKPPGDLVLDDDDAGTVRAFGHDSGPEVAVPKAYFRLAGYARHQKGTGIIPHAATKYVTKFQSRRSLLAWKIFGRRLDGWTNEDVKIDQDFTGKMMPPPEAVKEGKVKPLSDEDRRTIVRWIDLGCPIDLDPKYDPAAPNPRSFGWMGDDQRPTLTVTFPQPGLNSRLDRILVGMHDAYTGMDPESFQVIADFPLGAMAANTNLAAKFKPVGQGVWELKLPRPITDLPRGKLTVAVKDRQGNESNIERTFSVSR